MSEYPAGHPFAICRCGHRLIDHSEGFGCEVRRGGRRVDHCIQFQEGAAAAPAVGSLSAAVLALADELDEAVLELGRLGDLKRVADRLRSVVAARMDGVR